MTSDKAGGLRPKCRLFSYGWSNSHHPGYVVYRGARVSHNVTAAFVEEDAASDYCRYRNTLVDQRGDDSLDRAQPSREGGEPVMWRYPSVNGEWHTSETEPGVLGQEPLYAAAAPKPKG